MTETLWAELRRRRRAFLLSALAVVPGSPAAGMALDRFGLGRQAFLLVAALGAVALPPVRPAVLGAELVRPALAARPRVPPLRPAPGRDGRGRRACGLTWR